MLYRYVFDLQGILNLLFSHCFSASKENVNDVESIGIFNLVVRSKISDIGNQLYTETEQHSGITQQH